MYCTKKVLEELEKQGRFLEEIDVKEVAAQKLKEEQEAQAKAQRAAIEKARAAKEEADRIQAAQLAQIEKAKEIAAQKLKKEQETQAKAQRAAMEKEEENVIKIACQAIQSNLVMAIAGSNDFQKLNKFYVDLHCDQSSDQTTEDKNQNNDALKSHNDSDLSYYAGDVVHDGVIYREYVFIDEKTQSITSGYGVAIDGSNKGYVFAGFKPVPVVNKNSINFQQFIKERGQSINRMAISVVENTPVTQERIVDALFLQNRISREQAIAYYQQIEYQRLAKEFQIKLKQQEKENKLIEKAKKAAKKADDALKKVEEKFKGKSERWSRLRSVVDYLLCRTPQKNIPNSNNDSKNKSAEVSQDNNSSVKASNEQEAAPVKPTPGEIIKDEGEEEGSVVPWYVSSNFEDEKSTDSESPGVSSETKEEDDSDKKPEKTASQLRREQLMKEQDAWKKKQDLSNVTQYERALINSMHSVMANSKNDMGVELSQSSLQAWQKAQAAQSEEEYIYYRNQSDKYADVAQRQTTIQSLAQQAKPIYTFVVDTLLQNYNAVLKSQTPSNQKLADAAHIQRLEKRVQALSESKDQLRACKALPQRSYELSPQARGFMMANNINYAAFDGGSVTNFQHCLTQEILGIVESSASMAQNHSASSIIGQLARYNCNLAVSAQQLNQLSQIEQASILTDLTHFFDAYGKLLVDAGLQNQTTMNFSLGIVDGSIRALQKWGEFAEKLSNSPSQTLGELSSNLKNVGSSLLHIAKAISEVSPFAYLDDMTKDMYDRIHDVQQGAQPNHDSRAWQRTQNNAQAVAHGVSKTFEVTQNFVEDRMKKSTRENVAGVTEIVVDNMITSKVTDALLHLSSMVGNQFLQAADAINKNLPPHLRDSTVTYTATNTGDIIAIADATGENVATAMAAQAATNRADQIVKNTVRAKELADRINEFAVKNKDVAAKVDAVKNAEYHKKLAEVASANQVKSVDRLKEISKDIPQVDEFRKYTNDFKNLEKLNPEEVMYLNLCDWLEPQAAAINAEIKAAGGLKFIDPVTKTEVVIEKFDLVHSLLGEMKPQAVANRTSGGHLWISELRAATLDVGKIETFGNGFLDMEIKYAGKVSCDYKSKSYFSVGTSVEQAVRIIEDVIKNPKNIEIIELKNKALRGFKFTNQQEQYFTIMIRDKTVQFYPLKP